MIEAPDIQLEDINSDRAWDYASRIRQLGEVTAWFYAQSTTPEDCELPAALEAQREIKRHIRYVSGAMPWIPVAGKGNCYAFAWHTSLALDELEIENYITFTNDHVYNILVGKDREVHLMSSDQPLLNDTNVSPLAFTGQALNRVISGVSNFPLTTTMDTTNLRVKVDINNSIRHAAGKKDQRYPWLEAQFPVTTLLPPEMGRKGLYVHTCFRHELKAQMVDPVRMGEILEELATCNPQQETRYRLNTDIKNFESYLRRYMQQYGDYKVALGFIDRYCAAMPDTNSLRLHRGDWLRVVAGRTVDQDVVRRLAVEAEKSYKSSTQAAQLDPMRRGKVQACWKLKDLSSRKVA